MVAVVAVALLEVMAAVRVAQAEAVVRSRRAVQAVAAAAPVDGE